MNIKNQIYKYLEKACEELGIPDNLTINRAEVGSMWDYSSPIALKASKSLKKSPTEIADLLIERLKFVKNIKGLGLNIEIGGSGFINFSLSKDFWQGQVEEIISQEEKYGSSNTFRGKKARVEFVSANPTGPLHFGNARGGPIGDALASVLEFSGYEVLREYLHNDIGGQVVKLGESIANVAQGQSVQDQEYKGEYVKQLVEKIGNFETPQQAGKLAVDMLLDETLDDCAELGIKFDKVFPESGFVESGDTQRAIEELDKKGFIKEKDSAKWFAPNDEFLKDRETVVVKSGGAYTYFSNDIAYHKIKFSEGYDLVVDVFGANHHGHVPRLQAVVKAFGHDVSKFHVILYQWVRFKKGGELLAMSKRSGTFVTAREVLEMVGPDAVRFFILMHDANSHIDFDLDLAKEKNNKNPVYYVQYAHARICSILAKASSSVILEGAQRPIGSVPKKEDSIFERSEKTSPLIASLQNDKKTKYSLLSTHYELSLIKKLTELPELVEEIASSFAVNRLTTYATELADVFHRFYENCKVLGEEKDLESARLELIKATQITLANTLRLMGVSAPNKM